MIERTRTHHSCEQAYVSVSFILIPLGIHFNHIEPVLLPIPVEDALHPRPPTPLHAPPARSRAAHADLCHPRNVNVRPIDPRVPPPRAPRLLRFDAATGRTARTVRHTLLAHGPAAAIAATAARPTLAPVSTAAAINLLSRVTERGAILLPPAGLELRRR